LSAVGWKTIRPSGPSISAPAAACERELRRQGRGLLVLPAHRQRQKPAAGLAARRHLELAENELALDAGQAGQIGEARGLQLLVLGTEPAALGEIRRQRLAFEDRRRCPETIGQL